MRTIKFKAWDKKNKRMGDVVMLQFPRPWGGDVFEPTIEVLFGTIGVEFTTDELELLEFTGLLDKNGKEIFEGDVVDWAGGKGDVYFEKGKFIVRGFSLSYQDSPWDAFSEHAILEIIGNIYENLELL
jgi:hypothetical protein